MKFFKISLLLFCFVLQMPLAFASSITALSLEELMNTEVTSVSKTARPLSESASAVFVISQEDIRRSTATVVPELLRMVPGLDVARVTDNQWAITARGFNGTAANKMLVMVDGRAVYSPLFAGVFWDAQDMMLENIERIEVIRGPGATLWGSNAMNGVINIISKSSKDTKGGLATGLFGNKEQAAQIRYGGEAAKNLTYRGYGKYFNRGASGGGNDAWYMGRGGLRTDWQVDENDQIDFDAGYHNGMEDVRTGVTNQMAPFTEVRLTDSNVKGSHFITHWNHTYSPTSGATLQIYFDEFNRDTPLNEKKYTGDIDWKHNFKTGDKNEIVWGLGHRVDADETKGTFGASFEPSRKVNNLSQAFLMDTYEILDDKLWFTAGTRFEYNSYTGLEIQPTLRALLKVDEKQSVWAAVSRAVSTPSRLDRELTLNFWAVPGTFAQRVEGSSGKDSEDVIAYELGYRVQPYEKLTFDMAAFVNDYSHLRTVSVHDTFTENGYTVQRFLVDDQGEAWTAGAEIAAKYQAHQRLLVDLGYSYLQMVIDPKNDFGASRSAERQNPDHQIFIRPHLNLPYNIELDIALRYVSERKALFVRPYWELDLRVAWRPVQRLELSVVGQNLLHSSHLEFPSSATAYRPEQQRAVYGKTSVEF